MLRLQKSAARFLRHLIAKKSIGYRIGAFFWVLAVTEFGLWAEWHALAITITIVCGKHVYYAVVETWHEKNKNMS